EILSLLPKETLVSKTSAYQSVIQRPSFWGLVAAGLLLAAAAVITLLNRFVYSAESAVEDYVEALGNGDGATAIALSKAYLADDAPADSSTILLDGRARWQGADLLKDAKIVAADTEIPQTFRAPSLRQRVGQTRSHSRSA